MNIGEASGLCGLPAETIRYYEDVGLIEPGLKESGYRIIGENQIEQLAFIGQARSLGFTVDECRDLIPFFMAETSVFRRLVRRQKPFWLGSKRKSSSLIR